MNRIESVDLIRFFAIMAIIAIHTTPFAPVVNSPEIYSHLYIFINQISRFAVPFFFVTSGYFWGIKIRGGADIISTSKNMISRIGIIFLAWSIIYLLPFNMIAAFDHGMLGPVKVIYWNLVDLFKDPIKTLLQGGTEHLWFLVSLIFSISICALFVKRKAYTLLCIISIVFYVSGVLLSSYAETPIGNTIDFNTRNGPFFGLILFYSGYCLSGYTPTIKWFYYGLLIFISGSLIHFAEIYTLNVLFNISLVQDYVFGTLLMGIGMAMFALSNHSILRTKSLSKIGTMTLGIYASHYIFVILLGPFDERFNSVAWEIGYVGIVLILSILTTYALSRIKATRRLVL